MDMAFDFGEHPRAVPAGMNMDMEIHGNLIDDFPVKIE